MKNNVIQQMIDNYDVMTEVEKRIADFFVNNKRIGDFSAKRIANELFVSESSLSRFAKKMGYQGYREFIYEYQQIFKDEQQGISQITGRVLNTYGELLQKSRELVREEQILRIEQMLTRCKKVCVYGKGSSGFTAQDIAFRFMRMGLVISAITDSHEMKMNGAIADKDTLILAISLSGTTEEIITATRYAKRQGAKVVLVTMNQEESWQELCDEVVLVPSMKNLNNGSKMCGNIVRKEKPRYDEKKSRIEIEG